ncbi:MAG: Protein of unknown function (DUF3038) [Phormidium sp. OSCR]|nr:MAG: Protein of unknown function (DUF3038) [Phormidium sp. OSCR]
MKIATTSCLLPIAYCLLPSSLLFPFVPTPHPLTHLDLTLLALQALLNLADEAVWAAAVDLGLEKDLGDRLSLERLHQGKYPVSVSQQQRAMQGLVRLICSLAREHQETIRRAVALLEQYTQLERPAREAVFLGEYLQRFTQGYLLRSLGTLKLALVESLALKLLVDLLFYSGADGDRHLAWAVNSELSSGPASSAGTGRSSQSFDTWR